MRPLIAGNWKMHGLSPQLEQIKAIAASVTAADFDAVLEVVRTLDSPAVAKAAE